MDQFFKGLRDRLGKWWSAFKKLLALLMIWGLAFSIVTIGGLRAGFDYDDTLVFSTPAFDKAFRGGAVAYSPQFWATVNTAYDLETPKPLPNVIAWALKLFGFRITIIAHRPPESGEALKKEWRRLASKFIFVPDAEGKRRVLSDGRYVLFFGDSDSDITAARRARVFAMRVRRNPKSSYGEDYHPGKLGEWVIPLSQY